MKNLLYKEFRLAAHPTELIFLALSALMLIPNYPYYVTFFYTCLGVFFTCLSGRENRDVAYTAALPVGKRDLVRARFLLVILFQMLQAVTAAPFAYLRGTFPIPGNQVGIEANFAFFGLAFVMLGLFNYVFFTSYYRNPDKVGASFCKGSTAIAVYMILAETLVHVVPFMRDELDTWEKAHLPARLAVFFAGLALYALWNLAALRRAERTFDALDL